MIANLMTEEGTHYDARFQKFLSKLAEVASYTPRQKYLYPVMQGVPFKDFEVALDGAILKKTLRKKKDI